MIAVVAALILKLGPVAKLLAILGTRKIRTTSIAEWITNEYDRDSIWVNRDHKTCTFFNSHVKTEDSQ